MQIQGLDYLKILNSRIVKSRPHHKSSLQLCIIIIANCSTATLERVPRSRKDIDQC